jgi:WD40 repeat protein
MIRVWDTNNMSQKAVLIGHTGYIYAVCISLNGEWIISGGFDRSIIVWNARKKLIEATLIGHTHIITSLCICRDGRWII